MLPDPIREFTTPGNLLPRDNNGNINHVAERTANLVSQTLVSGRQDNRGFEGLTVSSDGTRAYAILQDPLAQEGNGNQGRRRQIVHIVEFDVATGTQTNQFAYILEPIADINSRIPGTADDFGANNQGRPIGVSSIIALSATKFLVLERDNRGIGNEDSGAPAGSKRIYEIDIAGATDIKS